MCMFGLGTRSLATLFKISSKKRASQSQSDADARDEAGRLFEGPGLDNTFFSPGRVEPLPMFFGPGSGIGLNILDRAKFLIFYILMLQIRKIQIRGFFQIMGNAL